MSDHMFAGSAVAFDEPRIAILDENTANQIAAGEVIERPASVVKELVENAIDSGASRIAVELLGSGKRLIRVTDDGCGMSQEDAILSLQRHATSKIRRAGDLEAITTMGFRGEALPSIASVSQVTIVTRLAAAAADRPATRVDVRGGSIDEVGEVGARPGTSITIENLFYNVPARLKFLKSDSTELHHVLELIQRMALARADIAFRLTHADSELFVSTGCDGLAGVCVQVFGRETARKLLSIDHDNGAGVQVQGMLGPPDTMRGTRNGQHLFVNRRFVRDRTIARALEEGYRSVQTVHGVQFALGVILVTLDPALVDVNVSPTKTEVRFLRERELFSAVYRAVQRTLIEKGGLVAQTVPMQSVGPEKCGSEPAQGAMDTVWRDPFERKYAPQPAGDHLGAPIMLPSPGYDPFDDTPAGRDATGPTAAHDLPEQNPGVGSEHRLSLRGMRLLAQTRNMYLLAQTEQSLLLIDQHIAHERVLYERLLRGQGDGDVAMQHLVVPMPIELGRREALAVEQRLGDLARAGFILEPFGAATFLIRAVPAQVAQRQSAENVVRAIIDELVEKSVSRRLQVPAEEVLITASCKMAIKAGDPLTMDEMRGLMDDLLSCDNPYTCPHGRPIMIEMFNTDLDRRFGRI